MKNGCKSLAVVETRQKIMEKCIKIKRQPSFLIILFLKSQNTI